MRHWGTRISQYVWGVLVLAALGPLLGAAPTSQPARRSRAEVEALIKEAGQTPPDWFNATPLKIPPNVDLTWNLVGTSNAGRNITDYLWSVVVPNPPRWHEGLKLVHHSLTQIKDDPKALSSATLVLGELYADMLGDYARGAYWARKSARVDHVRLANCYWKLGSKEMAVEILNRIPYDYTRNGMIIKLWADMGELDKALKLAEDLARRGRGDVAYLAAGDACRLMKRYPQALAYYEKALAAPVSGNGEGPRIRDRVQVSIEAIKLFETLDLSHVADGKYRSSGVGYNGPVEVEVAVKAGRIESVKVVKHQEKQFYSSITDTTARIVEKQTVQGIDTTSGATITSDAIINAAAKALAGGSK